MSTVYEKYKFLTELVLACSFLPFYLKRRTHFPLRAAASLGVLYLSAWFIPVLWGSWLNVLRYPLFLLLIMLCIGFCFRAGRWEILFCGVAGYTVQHCSYLVWNLLSLLAPAAFVHLGTFSAGRFLLEVVTYVPFFILFSFWFKKRRFFQVDNHVLLLTSLVILCAAILLNYTRIIYAAQFNATSSCVCIVYSIGACILSLLVQFSLLEQSTLKQELNTLEYLWHREREQYAAAQENIQLVNMKCHDLKHQISALRHRIDDSATEDYLRSAEELVAIYNVAIKTENEALDVILTEKSLLCERNQIKLTCMVDGNSLSFMGVADLYSIFGNLFDNAVEAVLKLDVVEKRVIAITGVCVGGLFNIHIENYFSDQLDFQDGLPVTTKLEKDFHGYGLKSVRYLVAKYGGEVVFDVLDDIFSVDIMIPLPRQAAHRPD